MKEPYGRNPGWTHMSPGFSPYRREKAGAVLDRLAEQRASPHTGIIASELPGWNANDPASTTYDAQVGNSSLSQMRDAAQLRAAGKPRCAEVPKPRGHKLESWEKSMNDPGQNLVINHGAGRLSEPGLSPRHSLHYNSRNVVKTSSKSPEASPASTSPSPPPWAAWPCERLAQDRLPRSSGKPQASAAAESSWRETIQHSQPGHNFGTCVYEPALTAWS